MDKALHRKQIAIGRGTKSRGTGIGYWDKTARTYTMGAAKPGETPSVREWNMYCLMRLAARVLDDWENEHLHDGEIVQVDGEDRNPATEKVVDKALSIVNTAVTKHCDKTGIEVDRLIQLHRPYHSTQLQSALDAVSKQFKSVFEKVAAA